MTEKINLPLKWEAWTITEKIGSGSYGTVYKACQNFKGEKRDCAIKIISVILDENNEKYIEQFQDKVSLRDYYFEIVMNFMMEIRTLEMLRGSKNIVEIYDSVVEERKDGTGWDIYIMMEYLKDISNTLSKTRDNEEKDVIRVGIDICSALEICEERNILHRDIKPENIMLSEQGNYKLVDFGVAKHIEGTRSSLSLKGTYTYMAPEVMQMKKYGNRADLYSLGLVLYKMMNQNKDPFIDINKKYLRHKDKEESLERRIKGEILPDPCNASPGFAEIILKTCEYNPAERYKSASELKKDLIKLRDGKYHLKKRKNKGGLSYIIPKYYAKIAVKGIAACLFLLLFGKIGIYCYNGCHYQLGNKDSNIRIDKNGVMTVDGDSTLLDENYNIYNIKKLVVKGDDIVIAQTKFPKTLEEIKVTGNTEDDTYVCYDKDFLLGTKYRQNHTKNGGFVFGNTLIYYEGNKTKISIKKEFPNVKFIADGAFLNNNTTMNDICNIIWNSDLGEKIPDNVNKIEEITGLDSITAIGSYAFYGCTSLTTLSGMGNVTSIGENACSGCTSLKTLNGIENVDEISDGAFDDTVFKKDHTINDVFVLNGTLLSYEGNSSSVNIKEISPDITSIGDGAFENCTSLESVSGMENVTLIGGDAFENCAFLKTLDGIDNVDEIEYGAFSGCASLETLNGIENVNDIAENAFDNTDNTVFRRNHTINGAFFLNGTLLSYEGNSSSVNIKEISPDITSIANSAFEDCTSLKSVSGMENVTSIGYAAFSGCTSLETLNGIENVNYIEKSTFDNTDNTVFRRNHTINGAFVLNGTLLSYEGNSPSVNIKEISPDITSIGDEAFKNCTFLKSVSGMENVTSIGYAAFSGCTSLETLNGIENVDDLSCCVFDDTVFKRNHTINDAFVLNGILISYEGNNSSVNIKEISPDITSIGECAFEGCTSLKSVSGMENITSIGDEAFYGCENLTKINGLTKSTLKNMKMGKDVFSECPLLTIDD